MTRKWVKEAQKVLNKVICNILPKKNIHFEDLKLEELLSSLVNVLLTSFQKLENVPRPTQAFQFNFRKIIKPFVSF